MNKVFRFALLLTFCTPFLLHAQSSAKGTLEITFTDLRSGIGQIAIGINKSDEGWPRTPHLKGDWKKTNGNASSMTVQVKDLEHGTYAISMLDDENNNLEMDNFLGVPKEGFGFSNDPKVGMSAPKFDECSFTIDEPVKKISIRVNYIGKGK